MIRYFCDVCGVALEPGGHDGRVCITRKVEMQGSLLNKPNPCFIVDFDVKVEGDLCKTCFDKVIEKAIKEHLKEEREEIKATFEEKPKRWSVVSTSIDPDSELFLNIKQKGKKRGKKVQLG